MNNARSSLFIIHSLYGLILFARVLIEREKSIVVVADTHFGLRNEMCFEPEVFSGFLRWVKRLEKCEVEPLKLGDWDAVKDEKVLEPPGKIILVGDILELWDASDRSVDICVRTFFPIFSELDCEKIYVLGNHDDVLEEIASNRKHSYLLVLQTFTSSRRSIQIKKY